MKTQKNYIYFQFLVILLGSLFWAGAACASLLSAQTLSPSINIDSGIIQNANIYAQGSRHAGLEELRKAPADAYKEIYLFDVQAIRQALEEVHNSFDSINYRLTSSRDYFDDQTMENMITAYEYLNQVLSQERDLTVNDMLELNRIVHTGNNFRKMLEYHGFLRATEQKFIRNINPIFSWYKKHADTNPWEKAAAMYAKILAMPQLFIEGNHRTGALIAGFILVKEGVPPFILNTDGAVIYFNISTEIKFSKQEGLASKLGFNTRSKAQRKKMEAFLQCNAHSRFMLKKRILDVSSSGLPLIFSI